MKKLILKQKVLDAYDCYVKAFIKGDTKEVENYLSFPNYRFVNGEIKEFNEFHSNLNELKNRVSSITYEGNKGRFRFCHPDKKTSSNEEVFLYQYYFLFLNPIKNFWIFSWIKCVISFYNFSVFPLKISMSF